MLQSLIMHKPETQVHLFELSLEHPDFPHLELRAVSSGLGDRYERIDSWLASVETAADNRVVEYAGRLAFTMRISRLLGAYDTLDELEEGTSRVTDLLAGKTSCIRVASRGKEAAGQKRAIEHELGEIVASRSTIDLEHPQREVRVLISGRRYFLALKESEVDRKSLDARQVKYRAFFSPVSIAPRFARGLLNLCGVSKGVRCIDPFCGTGGIMMEASLLGAEVVGSDIDRRMVEGAEMNLRQAGLSSGWQLHCMDVGRIGELGSFDAVVTDPPYGRSSYYNREDIAQLYSRALESMKGCLVKGGRLGIVVPDMSLLADTSGLHLEMSTTQRVHKSLVRNYLVFSRVV